MADYLGSSEGEEDGEGPAVGIDLGTTYSCVSIYQNGRAKVIANEHGNRITPSCVAFTENGILVGDDARNRLTIQPRNTVYECKRLIGRTFDDPVVAQDTKYWPFTVINDDGKPKIEARCGNKTETYLPEQISAMVLEKMKTVAEEYLGKTVTKAVITVPAYFNETQRKSTKDAARIAGLEVLRIINEPTAAAMAYGLDKKSAVERHILVFDLGGGTFDVSVLLMDEGILRVLATGGDTHLGGADFDNRVVDKIINWFNDKRSGDEQVSTDVRRREYHRLRRACEVAKCEISEYDKAKVQIECFHDDLDLFYGLEREEFEKLNNDLFEKTISLVRSTLADAKLSMSDLDDIVLVGGSTRIPQIRHQLQELFDGTTINTKINPDEAVACGAAIQAAILDGNEAEELEDVMLQDITPLSLGVNLNGDVTLTIVKRNSLVPCRHSKTLTTVEDDQTRIDFGVYQGERAMSKDNHFLGEFYMDGIPPAPRSVPKIEVTFLIDANNCIEATARDKFTQQGHTVKIDPNKAINSDEDINRLVEEWAKHHKEDKAEKDRITARSNLETLTQWVKYIIDNHQDHLKLPVGESRSIMSKAQEISQWLHSNYNNPTEEYKAQHQRLMKVCQSVSPEHLIPGNVPGSERRWKFRNAGVVIDHESDDNVPDVD